MLDWHRTVEQSQGTWRCFPNLTWVRSLRLPELQEGMGSERLKIFTRSIEALPRSQGSHPMAMAQRVPELVSKLAANSATSPTVQGNGKSAGRQGPTLGLLDLQSPGDGVELKLRAQAFA